MFFKNVFLRPDRPAQLEARLKDQSANSISAGKYRNSDTTVCTFFPALSFLKWFEFCTLKEPRLVFTKWEKYVFICVYNQ